MAIVCINRNSETSIVLSRGLTDFLKFIAAIMVAFGHYAGYALTFTDNPIYRLTTTFAGTLGVAIFFLLSGYGLMKSELNRHQDLLLFIKKRLAKVYLPVVLISFIWQVILWPKGAGVSHLPKLLYATFWGFSDGVLWFVKAIMICYILFRVYLLFRGISRKAGFVSLVIGTSIVYALVYYYFADWAAISIPLFSVGILLADYNQKISALFKSWWILLIVLLLTIFYFLLYLLGVTEGELYLKALFNWYVIITVLMLCLRLTITLSIPRWMGDFSYDIYITHNKVINYLKPLYSYVGFWRFSFFAVLIASLFYLLRKFLKI